MRPPADNEAGEGDDERAQGGRRQVGCGSPDEYGGSPQFTSTGVVYGVTGTNVTALPEYGVSS